VRGRDKGERGQGIGLERELDRYSSGDAMREGKDEVSY
jgi:hypothetical protein